MLYPYQEKIKNELIQVLENTDKIPVLGMATGSGKTEITPIPPTLKEIAELGEEWLVNFARMRNIDMEAFGKIKISDINSLENGIDPEGKKAELLRMAMNGEPIPKRYTYLGNFFHIITGKNSKTYDQHFDEQIRKIRTDWFKRVGGVKMKFFLFFIIFLITCISLFGISKIEKNIDADIAISYCEIGYIQAAIDLKKQGFLNTKDISFKGIVKNRTDFCKKIINSIEKMEIK